MLCEMQSYPGFVLRLHCSFLTMIAITPCYRDVGTVSKNLKKRKELWKKMEAIQTLALLKSARILRSVLES